MAAVSAIFGSCQIKLKKVQSLALRCPRFLGMFATAACRSQLAAARAAGDELSSQPKKTGICR
jgi:hypothetical protein